MKKKKLYNIIFLKSIYRKFSRFKRNNKKINSDKEKRTFDEWSNVPFPPYSLKKYAVDKKGSVNAKAHIFCGR